MARFDVYLTADGQQYLLDCQSDWLDHFNTRFMVPLVADKQATNIQRLHPELQVRGTSFIMATHLASAVPTKELGQKVASLQDQEYSITNALDTLIGTW
ncbi:MAG: CcdB family protein [Sphingomonadales bacterium]|jgi:toxin CcdB|uniref:CcdB family protein n=1 Tax=Sphingorhabdus sp. TaxID=1902408 RepID=UPI003BB22056|nr:CcdB family protein [Sphingomonadales bacterium]MBK9433006.1 CcdB family protein [Sphingomonadales bacterium]MBL0021522.1 CcdB family protein [Sphingomonadales bacterium]